MDSETVLNNIEHTVLGPTTTFGDVHSVLMNANEYNMRACIPPCYVKEASQVFKSVNISTVVGFPHGQSKSVVKAEEAAHASVAGADEIDMVANIGKIKGQDFNDVHADISEVVQAVDIPVKVIIETPLLSDEEKERVCEIARESGADFLKTATGFSDGGATIEDVELMSTYLPVKASGGVGTWDQAKDMFAAGAKRIGTSSGAMIAEEYLTESQTK